MKKTNLSQANLKGMPFKATLFLAAALYFTGCKRAELNDAPAEPDNPKLSRLMTDASTLALAGQTPFKVMSFNVRHHDDGDPQSLTERRANIRQIIVDNSPDVFGVQEFSDDTF